MVQLSLAIRLQHSLIVRKLMYLRTTKGHVRVPDIRAHLKITHREPLVDTFTKPDIMIYAYVAPIFYVLFSAGDVQGIKSHGQMSLPINLNTVDRDIHIT